MWIVFKKNFFCMRIVLYVRMYSVYIWEEFSGRVREYVGVVDICM